jgi:hypothetical protein
MDYVTVMLEEYKSVRQESLEALSQIHMIVQYGLASIGLSVGLGLVSLQRDVTAAAIVLMGLVPTLLGFGLMMTAVSAYRVVQTRRHLSGLEADIAARVAEGGQKAPSWERTRVARSTVSVNAYPFAILASIGAAAILGPGLGGALLYKHERWEWFVIGEWFDVMGIAYFAYRSNRRYREFVDLESGQTAAPMHGALVWLADLDGARRALFWVTAGLLAAGLPFALYAVRAASSPAGIPEIDTGVVRGSAGLALTAHVNVGGLAEHERYRIEVDLRRYRPADGGGSYVQLGLPLYQAQLGANGRGHIKSTISTPLPSGRDLVVVVEAWRGARPRSCGLPGASSSIGRSATPGGVDQIEEAARTGCVVVRLPND